MEKTIRVFGREVEDKTGKKFIIFSYTKDGERFYQVKFKRTCLTVPSKRGYWLIKFDTINCQLQKVKAKESFKPNDILWLSETISVKKDEEYEKMRQEKINEALEDLF